MNYAQKFTLAESRGEDGAFSRIDDTHPVEIFLGIEGGQRAVMVLCAMRPPDPPSLAAIAVDVRVRHDGKWALVLRLRRPDLKGLFTHLVEDLDGATRQQPGNPGEAVVARLVRWQRLLSQGTLGLLDDHQLRGICAELDFLVTEAISAVGPRVAVSAWVGPYDAPKDFVFEHVEVEVKAVHQQPKEIRISSLEQLTDVGKPLFLWSRVVELTDISKPDPRSVSTFVERVREVVAADASATEDLEVRLRSVGYEDRTEYGLRAIEFGAACCFRVAGAFPRLRRPDIHTGITSCSYTIAVPSLEPFRVNTWREAIVNAQ